MRNKQLDFLRGIAVILVLFRHHWVGIDALQHVGWVGVDLFFVLSGFLVSALLFKEYKDFGDVHRARFLIRRGFKIYPLFYVSLVLTLVLAYTVGWPQVNALNNKGIAVFAIREALFVQNYFPGFWGHHWSLAVEEHFYLLVALFFPLILKHIKYAAPIVFIGCLALRIHDPGFDQTHLRIDSLFAGVCVSYAYHFGNLERIATYRKSLIALACMPVLFIFQDPLDSVFTRTIGFSILYVSFSAILILSLYSEFKVPTWIAKIGFYSYGIYLFHLYPIRFIVGDRYLNDVPRAFEWQAIPSFIVFFVVSIVLGITMSRLVEIPFLAIRDKYFPRRDRTMIVPVDA
jgi:peptidoglycan/LPS O-acetylase OafA/YrhL